jgi:hypothetical protein
MPAPPPAAQEMLTISESDSLMIELNSLFQSIEDAIETENVSILTINELKNIPRILIRSVPALDEDKIGTMIRYVINLLEMLKPTNITDLTANEENLKKFLENVLNFLEESIKNTNLSPQQRAIVGLDLAKRFFSLTTRKIKDIKKQIEEIPVSQTVEQEVSEQRKKDLKNRYNTAVALTKAGQPTERKREGRRLIAKLAEEAGVPKKELDAILALPRPSVKLRELMVRYYPFLLE